MAVLAANRLSSIPKHHFQSLCPVHFSVVQTQASWNAVLSVAAHLPAPASACNLPAPDPRRADKPRPHSNLKAGRPFTPPRTLSQPSTPQTPAFLDWSTDTGHSTTLMPCCSNKVVTSTPKRDLDNGHTPAHSQDSSASCRQRQRSLDEIGHLSMDTVPELGNSSRGRLPAIPILDASLEEQALATSFLEEEHCVAFTTTSPSTTTHSAAAAETAKQPSPMVDMAVPHTLHPCNGRDTNCATPWSQGRRIDAA